MVNEEELFKNLAENILLLRRARNISQSQLAKLAQIPRSTITYMESGVGNPSLKNLHRTALALNVSVEELMAKPRGKCLLLKAQDIPEKLRASGAVRIKKLLPDPIPGMEIDRIELNPGALMGGVPHTKGTKEYFTCFIGQIKIFVLGEEFILSPGDVLAFPGEEKHSYRNIGRTKAAGFSVVVFAPNI